MQAAVEVAPLNLSILGAHGAPVSLSADSSRRVSLRTRPEKSSEPPTPNSPRTRLTRKRAASLDLIGATHTKIGDLALNSASTPTPSAANPTREQVCLCQPDPKIPRPRNAFILYRQHYQAQVVAQHPGLANPEISKIIGEQWREQASEVKSEWKKLAEEEKQRHQRQYPGYRYQPRRAGKANGVRPVSSSSADDPVRCPKCNGRYISTPSTPLTPFTPAFGMSNARKDRLLPPFTPSRTNEVERPHFSSQMQNVRMDTPRMAPPSQQLHRRAQYPQTQQLPTHHELDEEMELLSPSQDQKRRRFNNDAHRFNIEPHRGYPSASPISYSAPQSFSRNVPPSPYRQQQLPGPGMLARVGPMGPPPQQSPMSQHQRHQYPTRSTTFDGSLRLPPLQTQLRNSTPLSAQRPDSQFDSRDSQARSVEAMVMTIPYLNKIKVLTKISPPLPPPGPASPAQETRGAVIVIESADKELLAETGDFITSHLSQDASCAVKTWGTSSSRPSSISAPKAVADVEMSDGGGAGVPTPLSPIPEEKDAFVEYLGIIADWHTKSREMIKHITTPPSASSSAKALPIAIVPAGFSLTTSDTFALSIPIEDSYAPVDHWQWMATLWRGIVGPDLTVYVSRVGREEMAKFGAVEIKGDCNAIIVRVPTGEGVDEKTRRRLGFEVMEYVRGVENGFGRS
ncbi:Repressor of filamentous growth [Lachnellula subtilissima]|uniref:Repressor of filamentous growth n=1 Tax=Lachnellula subtilissima TaxID=602034 RepID=A0A8H8S124_9HELO|nr:Repressor of filamentous growth [Lachnellula subtilissima]